MCMLACLDVHHSWAPTCGGKKRALGPLDLELQTVVSHQM